MGVNMIEIESKGDFRNTEKFLASMAKDDLFAVLEHYGHVGVDALSSATPTRSGLTAASWNFEVVNKKGEHAIIWHNTNVNDGLPVAILIQYGHGTGTGGWVEGYDYINPAIRPIFDMITTEVWKQVTNG
jgi:hypothetical protein